jgi:hypothetical protein
MFRLFSYSQLQAMTQKCLANEMSYFLKRLFYIKKLLGAQPEEGYIKMPKHDAVIIV